MLNVVQIQLENIQKQPNDADSSQLKSCEMSVGTKGHAIEHPTISTIPMTP
jgi:hypothetical protein